MVVVSNCSVSCLYEHCRSVYFCYYATSCRILIFGFKALVTSKNEENLRFQTRTSPYKTSVEFLLKSILIAFDTPFI